MFYMDSKEDLDRRSEKLGEISKQFEEPAAVPLDILAKITADIDSSDVLAEIFGSPASTKLGVAGVANDIRLVDLEMVELSEDQRKVFRQEIIKIITSHAIKKDQ